MAEYDIFTTVDIGSRYTKAAVVSYDGEIYRVLAFAEVESRGIENGDVKDIASFKDNMNRLFDELEEQYPKLGKTEFIFSYSSNRFSLESHLERVVLAEDESEVLITEEMLEKIKDDSIKKMSGEGTGYAVYHFYPKRYIINDLRNVFNPVGMKARSLTMEFIAVKIDYPLSEMIKSILGDFIGEEVTVYSSHISSAEGVLTLTEKDSGVVVLELGHDFTTVIAYLNGIPVSMKVVPVGIKHVIKDIAYVLGTSYKEAEILLRNHGSATISTQNEEELEIEYRALDGRTIKRVSVEKLSLVINARLGEIMNKSRRIFKDLERDILEYRENGIPGGVILTGGGAKIKNIAELATQVFRTNVRIGTFCRSFPDEERVEGAEDVVDNAAFSSVFGNVVEFIKLIPEEAGGIKEKSRFLKALKDFFKNLF
ncbi:MAG: cell division protein FtsA [Thermotogaceae bacterium]|nr:cell division protein FtsA [Thermotogaceae bacterium]